MSSDKKRTKSTATYHCPLDYAMRLIGGRWKPVVLWWIAHDFKSFSELQAVIPDISQQVLSKTLQSLQTAGFLDRNEIRARPKRVFYELTAKGMSILPVMDHMNGWALEQLGEDHTFGYEQSLKSLGIDVEEFKRNGRHLSAGGDKNK